MSFLINLCLERQVWGRILTNSALSGGWHESTCTAPSQLLSCMALENKTRNRSKLVSTSPLVRCQRLLVYADWKADNAHSSNLQADSDWEATLEYLEDGGSRQVESVPPLPEPLQPPARQVMCRDSLPATHCCAPNAVTPLPSLICCGQPALPVHQIHGLVVGP